MVSRLDPKRFEPALSSRNGSQPAPLSCWATGDPSRCDLRRRRARPAKRRASSPRSIPAAAARAAPATARAIKSRGSAVSRARSASRAPNKRRPGERANAPGSDVSHLQSDRPLKTTTDPSVRNRARTAAEPKPLLVSQHTCLAVLGVTERRFLDMVRELAIPHLTSGKLRLVRPEDFTAALARSAEPAPVAGGSALAALGLRRRGGA